MKKFILSCFLSFAILPLLLSINKDNNEKLIIYTSVFLRDYLIDDVSINIIQGDTVSQEIIVRTEKRIKLELEYQNTYNLVFEKEGYISKTISINTFLPDNYLENTPEIVDFEMELFRSIDNMDLSIFDQPVAKIKYDTNIKSFDYDKDYAMLMGPLMQSINKEIAKNEKNLIKERKSANKKLRRKKSDTKDVIQQEATSLLYASSSLEQFKQDSISQALIEKSELIALSSIADRIAEPEIEIYDSVFLEVETLVQPELLSYIEPIQLKEDSLSTSENLIANAADIYFDFNSYALDELAKKELDQFILILEDHRNLKLEISGHTCNIGSYEANKLVSEARAYSAFNYLINKGISPDQLKYKGFSYDKPSSTNNTSSGRSKNRRVELKIVNDWSELLISFSNRLFRGIFERPSIS